MLQPVHGGKAGVGSLLAVDRRVTHLHWAIMLHLAHTGRHVPCVPQVDGAVSIRTYQEALVMAPLHAVNLPSMPTNLVSLIWRT